MKQVLVDEGDLERLRLGKEVFDDLQKKIAELEMERDRAEQAYAELHSSHRALTIARDENGARFIEMRDRIWRLETILARIRDVDSGVGILGTIEEWWASLGVSMDEVLSWEVRNDL